MLEKDSKEIEKEIISELKVKRDEVKDLEGKLMEIQIIIRNNCEHKWRRDSHPYAPLYCYRCGAER